MDDHNARAAILAIEAAGTEYADAVEYERGLEHYRPRAKAEAIARIMATENPETKRQHSASSAEKIVETDPDFWQLCQDQRAAAAATIRARARYEAARRTADLEVALVQASTQVLVHSGG